MSPLAIAEWIEIDIPPSIGYTSVSPLAIAEWIEISRSTGHPAAASVSASDSGVD